MSEPLRILIVDDHPIFRDGLRTLLDGIPGAQVVGEGEDGDQAVVLTERLKPDVVLMDVRMPGRGGIEATRSIVDRNPGTAVLVLTMQDDDASVFNAMRSGARGYLLKDVERDELLRAIETVAAGGAVFGPGVARRLITFFAQGGSQQAEPFPELTQREREVLDRIARGENNAAIAARLGISLKTVRNHSSMIFDKLMVADRGQAIVRAREAGLGADGERSS